MHFVEKIISYIRQLFTASEATVNEVTTVTQDNKNEQINILHNQKSTTMAMFNYGVGGNEVKVDANEAIQEIQENKTLLVSKLTTDETMSPEIVSGLKTVEDVFRHFQPQVAVVHETEDGQTVNEDFKFRNLGDFSPKNLTQNSNYLSNLSLEEEQYNKIIRQLRNNKVLRNILADGGSKAALIQALKAVASELEGNDGAL